MIMENKTKKHIFFTYQSLLEHHLMANLLRDAFKKKIVKFGDFVLNSLTPTLPPLIGTKKFRTICSAFGPPPSFMKLGQNGVKNLVHKL